MRFARAFQDRLAAAWAALALLASGCAGEDPAETTARPAEGAGAAPAAARPAARDIDGAWLAVAIDGRPVAAGAWRFGISDGKVSGGRDGCNDWGYGEPETKGGPRTIHSTLVGCPEDDPVRKAYWAIASAPEATLDQRDDGVMRIAARGHEALLRRCRWISEPMPPGVEGRGRRTCAE
jgi:heat shock protein HslJ